MVLEGYLPNYDKEDLTRLLDSLPDSEELLYEDRMINSDSGNDDDNFYGACMNWELRGKGYSLDLGEKFKELSGDELLADAYNELKKIKYGK